MAERFLIARLSALGDTVCCLPAAAALKRTFPECHITWAVDGRFAPVVECCGAVDEVVRVSKPLLDHREPYDAAFDLQGLLKSALCIAKAKATQKLGYHWQREGSALFSRRVIPDPSSFHIVDQYVDVVRAAGAQMDRADFMLKPKEEDVLSVRRKLKEKQVFGRFVVMNAGAGWETKRWPAASFARLIDASDLPVVLIGGRSDADHRAAEEVADHCRQKPTSLIGETSIGELIALIRLCSAHVGGDTGSTHLAAAMEIPAIGLYSITRPKRSCPYGQIDRCHYHPHSLAGISPDLVLTSLNEAVQ
ncbi:MAG TPA: glycosyltransferase family 9 protein [Fimbriimonas sp.]